MCSRVCEGETEIVLMWSCAGVRVCMCVCGLGVGWGVGGYIKEHIIIIIISILLNTETI